MVNCYLCSSLKRKEEKGSRVGELVNKYLAEGRIQGCKQILAEDRIQGCRQIRGIGADKHRRR
jgi:hypothetical protein